MGSLEETIRVLTDGGMKGKGDEVLGLKENVMIGKVVVGGRGMRK